MEQAWADKLIGTALRVGFFIFLGFVGIYVFAWSLIVFGQLITATLSTFLAGLLATLFALRVFERFPLSSVGLLATRASAINFGLGLAGGAVAALLVTAGPLLAQVAELRPVPGTQANPAGILFVMVCLFFGAMGEELLYRGYAFQVLLTATGRFGTILPVSVLFGLMHAWNPNANAISTLVTVLWAILFSYAFLRSGDLWLPIGLHAGWNLVLPLIGVPLSGYTLEITGYAMHWNVGDLWSGGNYGPEASVLALLVLPLVFLYVRSAPVRRQPAPLVPSLEED